MVEGGKETLAQFISLNMWDEALKIQGDVYLQNGLLSPKLERPISDKFMLNNDVFSTYFNT